MISDQFALNIPISWCYKRSIIQGVPQNKSDLVFGFFNPSKCISERKQGVFWKAEHLKILKQPLLFFIEFKMIEISTI